MYIPVFWRNLLPASSGNLEELLTSALNIEAENFSVMLVPLYHTTRCHSPEYRSVNVHCLKNFKWCDPHIKQTVFFN
jgi:hypothetical protein